MKKIDLVYLSLKLMSVFFLLVFFANISKRLSPIKVKNPRRQKIKDIVPPKAATTLRSAERINSYIEEQEFLLSQLEDKNKNKPLIQFISENIKKIELEAEKKQVAKLINNAKLIQVKKKLLNLKKVGC